VTTGDFQRARGPSTSFPGRVRVVLGQGQTVAPRTTAAPSRVRTPRRRIAAIRVLAAALLTLFVQCVCAVSSPASAAATATFGNTTIGSLSAAPGPNYKFGSVFALGEAGTAVSFSWYTKGGSTSQKFLPVVYNADSSGNPTTLLAKGAEVTVATNQAAGWVTSGLPAAALVKGNYLLGLMSGPNLAAKNYYATATNAGIYNANTYNSPTTTWGTQNRESNLWSFYVTYAPTQAQSAPANLTAPTITGTAQVGQTLTAAAGTWSNNPSNYAFQWQRCSGTACPNIPGATASSYAPVAADIGSTLDVTVTATNSGGSGQATSAATSSVQDAAPVPPANRTAPSISGTAQIGQVLTANLGAWSGTPTPTLAAQWQRCSGTSCSDIPGAVNSTYPVSTGDGNDTLVVSVTATNSAGSVSSRSLPTATIAPAAAPVNTVVPAVSGTAQVGQTLTTDNGTWTGNPPPSLSDRWQRCLSGTCADATGGSAASYTVSVADVGYTLQVVVTGTNSSGSATASSAPTPAVTPAPVMTTGTLGVTAAGPNAAQPGSGYKFGTVSSLSVSATATDFKWFTRGGKASQSFTPLIYNTDTSGNPTTLAAQGAVVTVAANQAAGWVTSNVPANTSLLPGKYVLALLSSVTSASAFNYYATAPNAGIYNNNGSTTVPTATWGQVNTEANQWSFYVDYRTSAPATPPANLTVPVISGAPFVGQTFTTTNGTWSNQPTAYAYRWQTCTGSVCSDISGAVQPTYLARTADAGSTLQVIVTASNGAGAASATSQMTSPIAAPVGLTVEPFSRYVIDPTPPGAIVEKALADLNNDGKMDAIIGTESSPNLPGSVGGLYWYEYPASGNVTGVWNRHTILAAGTAYEDMQTKDVDLDGYVDVIASVNGNVYWFRNPGTVGGAWQQNLIGNGYGENTMRIGDVDGDGKPDVVTNKYVFFQNTPTSWTTVQIATSELGVALLDIGSGKGADNIVTTQTSPSYVIGWYRNPREVGGNARSDPWTFFPIAPSSLSNNETDTVATGDIDGDGRMDVVVADSEDVSATTGLRWYQAPTDRTSAWTLHTIDSTYQYAHKLQLADIDGNGAIDIVTAEQDQSTSGRVSVFYNDGSGRFTQQVLSNGAGHNVAVGDIDGDGDIDIFNSAHGYYAAAHPLEIYLNGRN
jgi:FG-GAP-like repeat